MYSTSLISPDRIGQDTQDFINSADRRSITATLYSTSASVDADLLSRAGRVILNTGNLTYDRGRIPNKAAHRFTYTQDLLRQGVKVTPYGDPSERMRLHMKTYTGLINNQPAAFISTGNLSSSGLGTPRRSYEERRAGLKLNEINLGIRTTDPGTIAAVSTIQRALIRNQAPQSTGNVFVGSNAAASLITDINKIGKQGSITVGSAYLDDAYITAALVSAKERGASVTVLTSNLESSIPIAAGSGSPIQKTALDTLAAHGVNIYTPRKDDPLLMHLKAASLTNAQGQTLGYLGSHNLTRAARQEESVDILIKLVDPKTANLLRQTLAQLPKDYDLIKNTNHNKSGSKAALNKIEQRMYGQGLGELYKIDGALSSNYDYALIPGGATSSAMPYYPTVLPDEFFAQFKKGRTIPKLTLYEDLYRSRTGEEIVPDAIKKLDQALITPGLGVQLNRSLGFQAYTAGQGLVGSAFSGVGRGIDYLFGYYDFAQVEKERTGKTQGSIRNFLGLHSKEDKNKTGGPAETILSTLYSFGAGVAQAIAFYAAVNLPLQHMLGKLQEDTMMMTLTPVSYKGRRGQFIKKATELSRIFTFGPTYGGLINEALAQSSTQAEATELLGKMLISPPAKYMEGLKRVGSSSVAERLYFGDENSYFKFIKKLRGFDAARFIHVSRPLFELINPYQMGSVADRTYLRALDELELTISKPPTLQYKLSAENRYLHKFQFENIGTARISQIAKSFDKLGALLPLNLAYWFPALRNALDLPAFDPRKNLTWRDVFSIEDTTRWVGSFYSAIGNTFFNPAQVIKGAGALIRGELRTKQDFKQLIKTTLPIAESVKTAAGLWKEQFYLSRLEKRVSSVAPSFNTPASQWQQILNLNNSPDDTLRALHISAAQHYDQLASQVEDFVKEGGEFHSYRKGVDGLLSRTRSYLVNKDITSTLSTQHPLLDPTLPAGANNLIKKVGSREHTGVLKLKGALKLTGLILLTDLALDNYLFKNATSFFTQLKARQALDTKEGTVARFEFIGTPPSLGVLGAAAAVGVTTGLLFPNVIDVASYSKTQLRPSLIDQTDMQLDAVLNKVYQRTSKNQALSYLGDELEELSLAKARARESLAKLGRKKALRFNYQAAWAAGLATTLFTNLAFKGLAGLANRIYNNEPGAKQLDSVSALVSATTERLVTQSQTNAQTSGDWVDIGLGKLVAEANLVTKQEGSKVYSLASQITTPFFQVAGLLKTDTKTDRTSIGVGFQLAPVLGLGFSPVLPIGLKLNLNKKSGDSEPASLSKLTPFDTLSLFGRGLIGAVTGGANLTYEPESPFLNNLQALGLLTLGSAAAKPIAAGLKTYYPRLPNAARQELDLLFTQTQAMRKGIVGGGRVASSALEGMMTLPFVAGYGTYKATQKVFGRYTPALAALAISYAALDQLAPESQATGSNAEGIDSSLLKFGGALGIGLTTTRLVQRNPKTFVRLARHSRLLRRAAPYYLAFTMARLMSAPEAAGYVGDAYKDPVYQLQATLGVGLGLGYLLDKSGVFMSNVDMASAFLTRVSTAERARLLESVFPKAPQTSKYLTDQVDSLIDTVIKTKPDSNVRQIFNINSKLISQIAAPVLWDRALAFNATSNLDPQITKYGLRGRQLGAFTARLKLAGAAVGSAFLAANILTNLLSSKQLDAFYKLPILGASVRLLAGVEPESKFWGIKPDGVKDAARPSGLIGIINNILNKISFGLISPQESTGLYKDKSDPFLNILSPLGQSFRDSGPSVYFQAASPFSDLSVSSYKISKMGLASFLNNAQVFTGKEPDYLTPNQRLRYRLARLRGAKARTSSMTIDAPVSVYGLDAITSSGLKRELAIRQLKLDNLKYQRPGEVLYDLFKEGLVTGASSSTAITNLYRLPRTLNPLSSLMGQFVLGSKDGNKKGRRDTGNEQTLDDYFQSAIWSNRAGAQVGSFLSFDVINNTVKSLGGSPLIGLPITLLSLGAVSYSAFQMLTSLSSLGQQRTLEDLVKSSRIFQGQNVLRADRYTFSALNNLNFNLSGVTQNQLIQLDLQRGANKGYVLGLDTQALVERNLIKSSVEAASILNVSYKRQLASLNSFFNKDFSELLNKLVLNPQTQDLSLFRTQVRGLLRTRLEASYTAKVFGDLTYFESVFGAGGLDLNKNVSALIDELVGDSAGSGGLINQALDDVIKNAQTNKLGSKQVTGAALVRRRAELLSAFESSSGFSSFADRVMAPLSGLYTPRQEAAQFREVTGGTSPKQIRTQQGLGTISKELDIDTSDLLRSLKGEKPWGQGALTELTNAGKGAAITLSKYVDKGIPLYEVIEGAALALDKSQPKYLQLAGKRSAVRSAGGFLLSSGLAAGLISLGLPALAALGLGLTAAVGFSVLVNSSNTLRKLEEKATDFIGNVIFNPVNTFSKFLKPLGLGGAARSGLGLLTAPIGFGLGLLAKGVNWITRNLTGPLLGKVQLDAAKESLPMQLLKGLLLPQTAYMAELQASQDLMQQKLYEIQNAASLDFNYPLHPLLLGRAGQAERTMYGRYFTSYAGGGRVFQSFGAQNYRISNLLNLSLQRRQFLYESQVLGSTLTRINKKDDSTGLIPLVLLAGGAVAANFGFKRFKNKGQTLKGGNILPPNSGGDSSGRGGGGSSPKPPQPLPSGNSEGVLLRVDSELTRPTNLNNSSLNNPNYGRTTQQVIKTTSTQTTRPQKLLRPSNLSFGLNKLSITKININKLGLNKAFKNLLNKIELGTETKGLLRLTGQRATALFAPAPLIHNSSAEALAPFSDRVQQHLIKNLPLDTKQVIKESLNNFRTVDVGLENKLLRGIGTGLLRSFYGYQATRSGTEYGLALLRASAVEGSRSLINLISSPISNLIKRTDAKLLRVGLTTFDVLDAGFTGLDLVMGINSAVSTQGVSKNLNKIYQTQGRAGLLKNQAQVIKQLEQVKAQQLGSLGGNLAGTALGLISPNPMYGLLGGGLATIAGLFGYGGLSKKLAERDYERVQQGHLIYDPIQSSAFYLRTHRDMFGAVGGTHGLLSPARRLGKTLLNKTLRYAGRGLDFAFTRIATPLISRGLGLATSLITLGASSAAGLISTGLGTGAYGVSKLTGVIKAVGSSNTLLRRVNLPSLSLNNVRLNKRVPSSLLRLAVSNPSNLIKKLAQAISHGEAASLSNLNKIGAGISYGTNRLSSLAWRSGVEISQLIGADLIKAIQSVKLLSLNKVSLNNFNFSLNNFGLGKLTSGISEAVSETITEVSAIGRSATRLLGQAGREISQDAMGLINTGLNKVLNKIPSLSLSALPSLNLARVNLPKLPLIRFSLPSLPGLNKISAFGSLLLETTLLQTKPSSGGSWRQLIKTPQLSFSFPNLNKIGLNKIHFNNPLRLLINFLGEVGDEGKSLIRGLKGLTPAIRRELNLIKSGTSAYLNKVGTRLITPIQQVIQGTETRVIKALNKRVPNTGRTLAIKGIKESLLDVLSPVIDLGTFGVGVFQALNLNNQSSLADVEQAYITSGAARGSLVGSVFGRLTTGGLGEMLFSFAGQFTTGGVNQEDKALLRYQAQDYGWAPVLEDMVKPLIRDTAMAGYTGSLLRTKVINPVAGAYLNKINQQRALSKLIKTNAGIQLDLLSRGVKPNQINKLGRLNLIERVVYGTHAGIKQGITKQVTQTSARLLRVGGKPASTEVIKTVLNKTGTLAKGASKVFKVAAPIIDIALISSGYQKLSQASTRAEYESGARRLSGSGGSLAGAVVGSALGPVGTVIGSLAGDAIGNAFGKDIARRAYAKNISGERVANFQLGGLVSGGVAGALGVAALVGLGIVAAPLAIPALLIGAGLGALTGMIGAGYLATFREKQDKRRVNSLNKTEVKESRFLNKVGEFIFGAPAQAGELEINKKLTQQQSYYSSLNKSKEEEQQAFLLRQTQAARQLSLNKSEGKQNNWWESAWRFAQGVFSNVSRGITQFLHKLNKRTTNFIKQAAQALHTTQTLGQGALDASIGTAEVIGQAAGIPTFIAASVVSRNETTTYNGRTITRGGNKLSPAELAKLTPYGRKLYAQINNPNILAMSDVVARAEGTDFRSNSKNFGYSMIIGGSHVTGENTHPFVGTGRTPRYNSTASGRYQMMDFNYRGDTPKLFKGGAPGFSPAVQDLYFISTLDKRGVLDDVLAGRGEEALKVQTGQVRLTYAGRSTNTYAPLAAEYASLEDQPGRGFYPGQKTPEGLRKNSIPFMRQRLAVRRGQSSQVTTSQPGNLISNAAQQVLSDEYGVGKVTPYKIISFSGSNNALVAGIRGNYRVTRFEDLSPHWAGTGRYAAARRDGRFKVGYTSYLKNNPNQLVFDLQVSQNGSVKVPVLAAASGTVITAGGKHGTVAIRMKDGRVIRMLHNYNLTVKVGQQVKFGQKIGIQGDAGSGGGLNNYHIHLEAPEDVVQRYVTAMHTGDFIGGGTGNAIKNVGRAVTSTVSSAASRISRAITSPAQAATRPGYIKLYGHYAYREARANELTRVGNQQLHKDAAQAFARMQQAARQQGLNLTVVSGFRSIASQEQVFESKRRERGQTLQQRARVSAPAGFSQHHTGMALDISSTEASFAKTREYKWLVANAEKYGFKMPFTPGNNQGVDFEPWHWIYTGSAKAKQYLTPLSSATHPYHNRGKREGGNSTAQAKPKSESRSTQVLNNNQRITSGGRIPRGGTVATAERVKSDPIGALALVQTAQRLGLNPVEFAALMSWESAGTLNPNVRGGDGNLYKGIIQFSPSNQRLYGTGRQQSIAQQMVAVEHYLKDRGFKPGQHDIRHAYSAVLAGQASERYWNRRDSNGTTVRNAAPKFRSGAHYERARQFLKDSGVDLNNFSSAATQARVTSSQSQQASRSIVSNVGAGVGKLKPYEILSFSGNENALVPGIRGVHRVNKYEDLTPHWKGTGRYARAARDSDFKKGWRSYMAGNPNQLVYDLQVRRNGSVEVPIPSPVAGTVIKAGGRSGAVVIKMADGRIVRMLHNYKISVKPGQQIKYGQTIGMQGDAGAGGGFSNYHIHYEGPEDILRPYVNSLLTGDFSSGTSITNTAAETVQHQISSVASGATGIAPMPQPQVSQMTFKQAWSKAEKGITPVYLTNGVDPRFGQRVKRRVGDRPIRAILKRLRGLIGFGGKSIVNQPSPDSSYHDQDMAQENHNHDHDHDEEHSHSHAQRPRQERVNAMANPKATTEQALRLAVGNELPIESVRVAVSSHVQAAQSSINEKVKLISQRRAIIINNEQLNIAQAPIDGVIKIPLSVSPQALITPSEKAKVHIDISKPGAVVAASWNLVAGYENPGDYVYLDTTQGVVA